MTFAAFSSVVQFWEYLPQRIMILERNEFMSAIMVLPKIAYSIAVPLICNFALTGENTPYYLIAAMIDIPGGVIGIFLIIHFVIRYRNLAKLEMRNEEN